MRSTVSIYSFIPEVVQLLDWPAMSRDIGKIRQWKTPLLFAFYKHDYANQECKWKCISMFKYWVMHNSESYTDVVMRKHMKAI